jgi:hypothetical protein
MVQESEIFVDAKVKRGTYLIAKMASASLMHAPYGIPTAV